MNRSSLALLTLSFTVGVLPPVGSIEACAASTSHSAPIFDCNGNGIEDSIDIAIGSSVDADQNGVPDECQESPGEKR